MSADTGAITILPFSHVRLERTAWLPLIVGFFFSFRIFIILLSVRLGGFDAQGGAAVGLCLNLMLLVPILLDSFGPSERTLGSMFRIRSLRWVVLLLALSGCSLLWTVAVSVFAALAYWCGLVADTAMVILMLRVRNSQEISRNLIKGYVYGAAAVAALAWMLPAQSDLRLGDEELLGPNNIGYVCALGALLVQFVMRDERVRRLGVLCGLLAVTLLRSLSKTAIIAFAIAEIFILLRDRTISRGKKALLALVGCVVIGAFWGLIADYYEVYTGLGNQSETLSGRFGIWTVALDLAMDRPWIGHGFHSVWKVVPVFDNGNFEARHVHNDLLQQFYTYGALGIGVVVSIYWSLYREVRRVAPSPLRTISFGVLVFALVHGLTESDPFDLALPLWAVVLIGVMLTQAEASRAKVAL